MSIPVTSDAIAELDETVNLLVLPSPAAVPHWVRALRGDDQRRSPRRRRWRPSGLDPTLSTDGKVTTEFGGDDTGMEISAERQDRHGRCALHLDFRGLARYNTNGSLDTTFGTNGTVTTAC